MAVAHSEIWTGASSISERSKVDNSNRSKGTVEPNISVETADTTQSVGAGGDGGQNKPHQRRHLAPRDDRKWLFSENCVLKKLHSPHQWETHNS